MRSYRRTYGSCRRRGVVVVLVAVLLVAFFGLAALSVDIGMLYSTQAELQRSADAAALAAAAELGTTAAEDPEEMVREAATHYASLNTALTADVGTDAEIILGHSAYNHATGKFAFEANVEPTDAVKIKLRRTDGSNAGAVRLAFGKLFGVEKRGLEASAAAVLIPRDIAVVIDLSNSMNWDSQLRFYDRADGGYSNARDVWAALDGPEPSRPYMPGSELESEYAADSGPTFGYLDNWGDALVSGYNPTDDSGLYYISRYSSTSNSSIQSRLSGRGYSPDEIGIIMSGSKDGTTSHWRNRTGVMLGLATWRSGRPGGLYSQGDGDNRIEDNETVWLSPPSFALDWNWKNYVDWVASSNHYASGFTDFRYHYGLKTFVDFLLESEPQANETNGLWATPQQPLRATKDAVQTLADVVTALDGLDHMALEIFASTGRHEVNLSGDLYAPPNTLYERQSGHYDRSTNIAAGLLRAYTELTSSRARPAASKVIILMSDGVANTDEDGNWLGDGSEQARQYARDRAQQAADDGMTIYTVSVGYAVDRSLMQEIAEIGGGQEFYAVGNPEEYTEQLELIFRALGGKRPVALIE